MSKLIIRCRARHLMPTLSRVGQKQVYLISETQIIRIGESNTWAGCRVLADGRRCAVYNTSNVWIKNIN